MQKLGLSPSVSPGGPVGGIPSGIGMVRRSGPTVQSLIQSIEDQVGTISALCWRSYKRYMNAPRIPIISDFPL